MILKITNKGVDIVLDFIYWFYFKLKNKNYINFV